MRRWRKPKAAARDDEVQFHIEALIEEKIEHGLTRDHARREEVFEFGGAEQIKSDSGCRLELIWKVP